MQAEFDGLEAAETSRRFPKFPQVVILWSQCLLKWKGDEHCIIDRSTVSLVAKGCSQVEGVDYFDIFAPTASTTSNRLVAAMTCKLDGDLGHLDIDQALFQSELDIEICLRLPPGCGRLSGKVVRLNKSLYGLRQIGCSRYRL